MPKDDNTVVFSYPVLDIIAVCFALLAICVAIFGVYKATQTAANTSDTVDTLNLTYQEIHRIRIILETSSSI